MMQPGARSVAVQPSPVEAPALLPLTFMVGTIQRALGFSPCTFTSKVKLLAGTDRRIDGGKADVAPDAVHAAQVRPGRFGRSGSTRAGPVPDRSGVSKGRQAARTKAAAPSPEPVLPASQARTKAECEASRRFTRSVSTTCWRLPAATGRPGACRGKRSRRGPSHTASACPDAAIDRVRACAGPRARGAVGRRFVGRPGRVIDLPG